jgi:transcriptional regulator CtsR
MNSASEKLAALIIDRLVREKLLTKTEAKKILLKLTDGKMHPDDWRAALELTSQQKLKL